MLVLYAASVTAALTALVPDAPASVPARLAARVVRDVTAFGATGDGATDDTAAIQRAVDSLEPGDTLAFPAGTYLHADLITVERAGVRLEGLPGATLEATAPDRVAIVLRGDGVALSGFTLTAPNATRRLGALEHHRIVLDRGSGQVVEGNHVEGGPAAGIFAFGASDFAISGNTVENTMADGIHLTFGARDGTVTDNAVRHSGDDCIAVVSYVGDGAIVSGISEIGNSCVDSYNARGFSVVGGQDIEIRGGRVDLTRAAGIYLASEGSFDTYAAHRVQVVDNHITRANTDRSIDHAAIFSYARPGTARAAGRDVSLQNEDVLLSGNVIDGTVASWANILFNNPHHRRVVIEHQRITGDPGKAAVGMGGTPTAEYRTRSNTLNGAAVPEEGGLAPAAPPAPPAPPTTAPTPTTAPEGETAGPAGTRYTALAPARLLDTRVSGHELGPAQPRPVAIRGRGGVPAEATSVVLNATVVEPTMATFVAIYPSDVDFPGVSNVNARAGDTVPNLVAVPLGNDGEVMVLNGAGHTDLVLDVVGYFSPQSGGGFHPSSPTRVLDTRALDTPLAPGEERSVNLAGVDGIKPAHLRAASLNVTVTGSTTGGYLTVFPEGTERPEASNLNFAARQTVPNAVVSGVDAEGDLVVYNPLGHSHVIIDITGWYDDGTLVDGLRFHPLRPTRILDTRGGPPVHEGGQRAWSRAEHEAVAPEARALALNVTVTDSTGAGFVTIFPGGPRPWASTQNTSPGVTRASHVLVALSPAGALVAYNSTASTHLVYDVAGWFG